MKNLLIVLLMVFGLFIPTYSYAQVSPTGSVTPSQVMSPEDMMKMREQLAALSKAMGNPVPSATNAPVPADSAKPINDHNISDVANKALDMMGTAVATLSSSISKIAPHVWVIMIRQQYAKAVDNVLVPFFLLIASIIYTVIIRKKLPPADSWDQDWDESDAFRFIFRGVIPTTILGACTIWFVSDLGDSIKLLINPEYYAIKDILLMLTNPGSTNL